MPTHKSFFLFLSYLLMGDELGSATDIDRFLGSSGRSTPIFSNDREGRFLALSYRFRPTMSPKNGNDELSWISRGDRVGLSNCVDLHMHYCATASASNFQVLTCSG